jgi:hypothetical protein
VLLRTMTRIATALELGWRTIAASWRPGGARGRPHRRAVSF